MTEDDRNKELEPITVNTKSLHELFASLADNLVEQGYEGKLSELALVIQDVDGNVQMYSIPNAPKYTFPRYNSVFQELTRQYHEDMSHPLNS